MNTSPINKFLAEHFFSDEFSYSQVRSRPRIVCMSGLSLSVQADTDKYCAPKETFCPNATQKYTHVEVGFPNQKIDEIIDWAEDTLQPTETIYAYVPVSILERVIESHGGLDKGKIHINNFINEL